MLTQRLSWLLAPGRVVDLSVDSNSRRDSRPYSHPPSSYSYSCSTTPYSSRPNTPLGTPLYDRLSMSVRALPAVPGSSSSGSLTATPPPPTSFSRTGSQTTGPSPGIRPLPLPPSRSQVSLAATTTTSGSGSTATVRLLPVPVPNMSSASLTSVEEDDRDEVGQLESRDRAIPEAPSPTLSNQVPSESTSDLALSTAVSQPSSLSHTVPHSSPVQSTTSPPSRASPLARLNKKKRQLSRDLLRFGESVDSFQVSLPTGVDFQMIPQHHLQTQHSFQSSTSPTPPSPSSKPPTPNKPPRLNLGLFSSRARKESSVSTNGRRPSTPGSGGVFMRNGSGGSDASASATTASCEETYLNPNTGSLRKRGSTTTGMFRSPSPGAVGMRKAASAGAGPVVSAAADTTKPTPPSPPPKPAKLKAHAQGLLNSAIGLGSSAIGMGMGLGTRSVSTVMPNSPSIAAAIEYMRHEQDPPRRAVLDEKRDRDTIYGGPGVKLDGNREEVGGSREQLEQSSGGSREHIPRDSSSQEQLPRSSRDTSGDEESDAESQQVHGQPSISDLASPGHKTSFSDAGKSSFSDAGKSSFSDAGADTSSGPSSSVNSLLSSNTGTGTSAHTDPDHHDPDPDHHDADPDHHDADVSFGSECLDPAYSMNPSARPQTRVAQDPDKRVSTASSQRTVMAWNNGGFVFPNVEQQGAPLARLHTTDGNLDTEPEPEPMPKATPRPARLGQLAGSLKRRSASMSILLPPMMSPRSPDPSSEASSPRLPSSPPPLPTRPRPRAHFDGAVTDSEGTTSLFRKRSRRVQGGIKGKIAAWTAAADQTRPRKQQTQEPRRSDSPQGYPYTHSPASAPALQVHTHVQLPAHAQTPLMSIAALAPAARDLALGVGKRVEKFYRARSASGAGHEPRPSLGGVRAAAAARSGMAPGVEPVLSALLRPAIPGASKLLFGRALDDPSVLRDMEGWVDETLGVRRCVGLPAFVSRSVRHLERWGGDEEGLFRISGRPGHVSRLRAEFDAGADYDLYDIPPCDLDPHAVSHLFKAYLRQLPEPILTRALKSQFDMAMTATDSSNASFDVSKLPTSMTSFGESSENMRSLDDALLSDIKVLVDQLPQVNYNLLHELCHLLRYTTEHVHTTKMPIGNLLLLFCPTLGLSAGFLRCLVEGQDVLFEWGRKPPVEVLSPPPLPPRSIKTSVSTVTGPTAPGPSRPVPLPGPSKHAPSASATVASSSIRSLKSPLSIDPSSPRARSQTTGGTGSGPPSRASMFFPNLPKRPSISRLFGVGSSNHDLISSIPQESRYSSSSSDSYMTSDDERPHVHPKRQTLPPRVSLDIPDGSFAPSLSPMKDAPEAESGASSATTKRPAQTPIADMFKSPLTAAVPTIAPSTVTATAVPSSSKTLPPRLGLQLGNSEDADEMGWSRGVLDAASSASLGRL